MAALEDMGGQATLTVESKLMEWLIKQADLLKLATMINTNDELTKWVKDGHELAQPFEVPAEISSEFEDLCKQQEIAFSQLNYDSKDYPLADPSETGVMVYTCKQCDRDQAYRIAKACEKKLNKEKNFELTADTINEEFNGIETNMLTNLTNVEADILQKEMAANNIYSAKLYNAETKTYAVEISAQDMEERTFKDEMTPLERSMAASVLKLSNPALMEYLNRKDAAREAVSGIIEQASHNPEIAQVIADPEHPKNRFIVKDSKVMFTIDNTVMNTYDLANKKEKEACLGSIAKYDTFVVTTEQEYNEERKNNFNNFKQLAKKNTEARILNVNIDDAAKELEQKDLIDFTIHKSDQPIDDPSKPEILQGHDFAQKEFRLERTDEVRDIIGKISPTNGQETDLNQYDREDLTFKNDGSVEVKQKINLDLGQNVEELVNNAQNVLTKFGISQAKEHMEVTTKINQYAVAGEALAKGGYEVGQLDDIDLEKVARDYEDRENIGNAYYGENHDYDYVNGDVPMPEEMIDVQIKDDMYENIATGESMTYEEAMNMPSEEEPDLDDNLANGLLDEDGPAAITGEDIWAGDDDEDIEYDDNYDDFMFD